MPSRLIASVQRSLLPLVLLLGLAVLPGVCHAQTATEYFAKGYDLAEQGDIPLAVELYERGLQLDPDNVEAHFRLADLLTRLHPPRTADAMAHYKAVTDSPRESPLKIEAIVALRRMQREEQAKADAQRAAQAARDEAAAAAQQRQAFLAVIMPSLTAPRWCDSSDDGRFASFYYDQRWYAAQDHPGPVRTVEMRRVHANSVQETEGNFVMPYDPAAYSVQSSSVFTVANGGDSLQRNGIALLFKGTRYQTCPGDWEQLRQAQVNALRNWLDALDGTWCLIASRNQYTALETQDDKVEMTEWVFRVAAQQWVRQATSAGTFVHSEAGHGGRTFTFDFVLESGDSAGDGRRTWFLQDTGHLAMSFHQAPEFGAYSRFKTLADWVDSEMALFRFQRCHL